VFDNVSAFNLKFDIVKGRKDTDIRYDVERV
jgi:hypothetical protein